ncbi:MAG TPA: YdcF family protein [Burkholderiales bacterium]|nr:YdcF family protein [Burkholderiales bacterium]
MTAYASVLLLPPFSLLLLAAAGWFVIRSRPRLARALIGASLVLFYFAATPYFADQALKTLEAAPLHHFDPNVQAIVVLGSGTYFNAPEYGGDTVTPFALQRVRYAAKLQRETGKPLLAAGGNPRGGEPEAIFMKRVLEREFDIPVRWTETRSRTTRENALLASAILKEAGISRIYLVTHSWHIPRAAREFERAGLVVTAAPTDFSTPGELSLLHFLPNARALVKTYYALHEALGLAWYWLTANLKA